MVRTVCFMPKNVLDDNWDPSSYDSKELLRRASRIRMTVTGSFIFIMFIYMTVLLSR
jgi:hypothetical protein